MPPHPGSVYMSSALCSCGEWQYDTDTEWGLVSAYRDVLCNHTVHAAEARATPPALDEARAEIQANRAQGVQWDPPVSKGVQRWYSEGYDRGLRDADAILARLSASGEPPDPNGEPE
jgi:hypothetical protein